MRIATQNVKKSITPLNNEHVLKGLVSIMILIRAPEEPTHLSGSVDQQVGQYNLNTLFHARTTISLIALPIAVLTVQGGKGHPSPPLAQMLMGELLANGRVLPLEAAVLFLWTMSSSDLVHASSRFWSAM